MPKYLKCRPEHQNSERIRAPLLQIDPFRIVQILLTAVSSRILSLLTSFPIRIISSRSFLVRREKEHCSQVLLSTETQVSPRMAVNVLISCWENVAQSDFGFRRIFSSAVSTALSLWSERSSSPVHHWSHQAYIPTSAYYLVT